MKKIFALTIGLFLISTAAHAKSFNVHARFNPAFAYLTKFTEGGTGVNIGAGEIQSNIRNYNPGFDFSGDIVHESGFGGGLNIFFMPADWSIWDLSGSITGDLDVVAITFGPRYYFDLNSISLYGEVGVGYYNTEASATLGTFSASDDENSFGTNFAVGAEWTILRFLTVGGRAALHYIFNMGGSEDGIIFSIGPTVGLKF